MATYESFATVYDRFMDEVPYEEWVQYIEKLFNAYSMDSKLILDLGCGTGNVTLPLSKKGYEMIGIDNSEEMLMIAKEKASQEKANILYLNQDMREFELYGTVGCVISICDSINYILEESDLLDVFKLVNNYLDPEGLFIFDLNTEYKYKSVLGNNVFGENKEHCSYIWENYYYEEDSINEYNLTLFVEENGLYRKYEEEHYQKAYDIETIKDLLKKSGLEFLEAYDAFTMTKPKADSERIYIIAKEKEKLGGKK
ncbi:methyltransferase family protein [Natranaerovirga hydrolytica]|uniref:Methyltransferase family protein n=1 Tax=Natranaerovirga hydrolytica TaxID=680378 RepID=A0A4R1MPI6_9FIRM|nr:class I SAM-dependent methyltransferase [Natranaerovirga hydrolytica]TCK92389.1 methyltransferase family protein [Natranaerovirga hydrolytica]